MISLDIITNSNPRGVKIMNDKFDNNKGYDLNEFDDDKASNDSFNSMDSEIPNHEIYNDTENEAVPDYGDDFDSQTGEGDFSDEGSFDSDDDNEEYYINTMSDSKSLNKGNKAKSHNNSRFGKNKKRKNTNKKLSLILTAAAVVCLILAVVFAVTQCNSKKANSTATTSSTQSSSTTQQVTTEVQYETEYVQQSNNETQYVEPQTEYVEPETETQIVTQTQIQTEAPTVATAQPQTDQAATIAPPDDDDDDGDAESPVVVEG